MLRMLIATKMVFLLTTTSISTSNLFPSGESRVDHRGCTADPAVNGDRSGGTIDHTGAAFHASRRIDDL
jgi:hypothetical protein